MFIEDWMVMDLFEVFCIKEVNCYVIGLLWKKDFCLLLNNYLLVEWCFEFLEWSLFKNEEKVKMYNCVIEEYIENGWVCLLIKEEL